MEIKLPRRFDRDELNDFFDQLDCTRDREIIGIDFSTLTYSYPTAMLVAGAKLREWVMYRHKNRYTSYPIGINQNKTVHSYLMHLGFFYFIYMEDGNRIGQARGSTRYLPITEIEIPSYNPSQISLVDWHGNIAEQSRRLAGVLVGSHDDSEELRAYSYSIREIIRNVFEHSGATKCYICGQSWINGKAEIAIIDEGVGIFETISKAYFVKNDEEAIKTALLPGASRTNSLNQEENTFDNSGFGLYVLSNLASSFGWFALGSGSARVIGLNSTERIFEPFSFPGTFIGIHLRSSPKNFRSVLKDIIEAGEAESGKIGITKKASGMSRIAE